MCVCTRYRRENDVVWMGQAAVKELVHLAATQGGDPVSKPTQYNAFLLRGVTRSLH